LWLLILLEHFYDLAKKTVLVKEATLSPSHVSTGDAITSSHIRITSDALGYICLVGCALRDEFHVEKILIPPDTQINHHLSFATP
jgi:hypothetical protein